MRARVASVVLIVGCLGSLGAADLRLKQRWIAVAPAAGAADSARWSLIATVEGGPSGAVSSCAAGLAASVSGPARFAAPGVAVRLVLDRDAADPEVPLLSWSGNASAFTVFRDPDPLAVTAGSGRISIVSACGYVDAAVPSSPLLYYLVTPAMGGTQEVQP